MRTTSGLTERFFRVLVEEIRARAPEYLTGSFTVAEIYQALIPYRSHRDRLGVEMNGDYEDTLLRLLGGEDGYLVLESEPARARIRRELSLSNPDTGIYREFAAVGVRLAVPFEEETGASGREGPSPEEGAPALWLVEGGSPVAGEIPLERRGGERRLADRRGADRRIGDRRAGAVAGAGDPAVVSIDRAAEPSVRPFCGECGERLPEGKPVRFCPECGSSVLPVECEECGESLDRAWKFCVSCGTPTPF